MKKKKSKNKNKNKNTITMKKNVFGNLDNVINTFFVQVDSFIKNNKRKNYE